METKKKVRRNIKSKKNAPRLWNLTVKNLKTMFRDKAQLAWIFGYPLLFIVIFAIAFGGATDYPMYDVVVFNEDEGGYFSELLVNILEDDLDETLNVNKDYDNYNDALEDLKYEKFDAIIIIEKNFSLAILNNQSAEVEITAINDQVVEGVIASILNQIINDMTLKYNNLTLADVNSKKVVDSIELEAIDYLAPGFIIAGTLVIVSQLATHFAEEKEKKTLERLATTPVARRDIILSGMFSQLAVAAVQTIIMLLVATQIFGAYIHPDSNLLLLFLIPMLFAFTCLGLGLILASFLKSASGATGLIWLIILPLQFLGGIFSYGVDVPLSEFIPTTYAVHAMRLVMTSGITAWEAIGMDLIVLTCTGIAFTIVGILLFQRKTAIT